MSLALIFEARLSCVIQTKLKLQTLFPQPLMCWDYKHSPLHKCERTPLSRLQCVSATCREAMIGEVTHHVNPAFPFSLDDLSPHSKLLNL